MTSRSKLDHEFVVMLSSELRSALDHFGSKKNELYARRWPSRCAFVRASIAMFSDFLLSPAGYEWLSEQSSYYEALQKYAADRPYAVKGYLESFQENLWYKDREVSESDGSQERS